MLKPDKGKYSLSVVLPKIRKCVTYVCDFVKDQHGQFVNIGGGYAVFCGHGEY